MFVFVYVSGLGLGLLGSGLGLADWKALTYLTSEAPPGRYG